MPLFQSSHVKFSTPTKEAAPSQSGYKKTPTKEDFKDVKDVRTERCTQQLNKLGGKRVNPNCLSEGTWWWVGKFVNLCYQQQSISEDQLPLTPIKCESDYLQRKFASHFFVSGNSGPLKNSMFKALALTFQKDILLTGFLQFGQNASNLAVPFFISNLLAWFQNPDETLGQGVLNIALLTLFSFAGSGIFFSWNVMVSFRTGMDIRSVCNSQIYRKAMRLSTKARSKMTQGAIMTLMSTDAEKLPLTMITIHNTWASPLIIFFGLYFLYTKIQNAAFVALAILLGAIPLQMKLGILTFKATKAQMKFTDSRNSTINEALQGIKILKLYAWESFFQKKIQKFRDDEMVHCAKFNYIAAYQTMMYVAIPLFINVGTFGSHYLMGGDMDPSTIFTAIALLQIIRMPLTMLPMMIIGFIQAQNALSRMQKYFDADEQFDFTEKSSDESISLKLQGDFSWEESDDAKKEEEKEEEVKGEDVTKDVGTELTEIKLETQKFTLTLNQSEFVVKKGELIAIVGEVGSGKSSLISALLGEMEPTSDKNSPSNKRQQAFRVVSGNVSYSSQVPWIVNETVKNNITMGLPFNQEKFNRALELCALVDDLRMLPAGVNTEIGEKGINLSGGQKARLCLARCVYREADVVFLDDPLSAVDAHVGKHLFEKCISGAFEDQTVILATNQLQVLSSVSRIIVLKNGAVTEQGTYKDLYEKKGEFMSLMDKHNNKTKEKEKEKESEKLERGKLRGESMDSIHSDHSVEDVASQKPSSFRKLSFEKNAEKDGTLVENEDNAVGNVNASVFRLYFIEATKGGIWVPLALLLASFSCQMIWNFHEFLVGYWTEASAEDELNEVAEAELLLDAAESAEISTSSYESKFSSYFTWWAITGGVAVLLAFVRAIGWAWQGLMASRHLHQALCSSVFRFPMQFFDTTPLGRIINRFSKDMYMVDLELPKNVSTFIICLSYTVGTLITICFALPWFTAVLMPVLCFYYYCQSRYRPISRDLQRIESASRSPIFAQFSESVGGVSSVRAYDIADQMVAQCDALIDRGNRAFWLMHSSNRWLQIRLEILSACCMAFVCFFIVYGKTTDIGLDAGFGGLIITYIQAVNGILNWTIRMGCETEARITSVERIFEMASEEKEAAEINEDYRPPENWPSDGKLTIKKLSMRYRQNLDLVLRDVSFEIPGGSKVGIAGRTGSGKSSLLVALFRLCEPCGESSILIDDVDCLKLGLADLRGNLAIIPQDPIMFCGTIRENLDPTGTYDDEALLNALEFSHLGEVVANLDEVVTENGDNYSAGQKQLFCMARAILKKPKILCLDEATANVDLETDDKIQKTIREQFSDSTIITIAHRLNTIVDSDIIIVMDDGELGEIGSPAELGKNRTSLWSLLLRSAEAAKNK